MNRKYENFCKALSNLEEGAALEPPYTVVEQAGIVGLFEICFEQSWKLMKDILEDQGMFDQKISSPRAVIKLAYKCGLINRSDEWLKLLEARNLASHTYSDRQALKIIENLKTNYVSLFEELKDEIDRRFI